MFIRSYIMHFFGFTALCIILQTSLITFVDPSPLMDEKSYVDTSNENCIFELEAKLGPQVTAKRSSKVSANIQEAVTELKTSIGNLIKGCASDRALQDDNVVKAEVDHFIKAIDEQISRTKKNVPPEKITSDDDAIVYFNNTGLTNILTTEIASTLKKFCNKNQMKGALKKHSGVKKRIPFLGPIMAAAVAAARAAAVKVAGVAVDIALKAAATVAKVILEMLLQRLEQELQGMD